MYCSYCTKYNIFFTPDNLLLLYEYNSYHIFLKLKLLPNDKYVLVRYLNMSVVKSNISTIRKYVFSKMGLTSHYIANIMPCEIPLEGKKNNATAKRL